jgi:ATP-dependent Lon protease
LLPYYDFPELQDLKSVMLQSMPSITSKFAIDYYYSLKTIDMKDNIYNKSLLNSQQNSIVLSDDVVKFLIGSYTYEGGVRKLKQLIFDVVDT